MDQQKLYYTITEVAELLQVNSSLLRFWETEFPEIKPTKNAKGTRRYTPSDIDLLRRIKYLTKECGFTLDGAREQLRVANSTQQEDKEQLIKTLKSAREFLVSLKEEL